MIDRPPRRAPAPLAAPRQRSPSRPAGAAVAERLRASPHVLSVHMDAAREVARVAVHPGTVTAEGLAEQVAQARGDRNAMPLPKPTVSSHAHATPPDRRRRGIGCPRGGPCRAR